MASAGQATLGAEVYGMTGADLATIPRIGIGSGALGDLGGL